MTTGPIQSERQIKAELWQSLIENQKHAGALAVALFYLSGFLTLNAHLAKFGISEFDIASTRYLLAAGNFTFFLLCYGLFAGSIVVSIHDWLKSAGRRVESNGTAGLVGAGIVIARSLTLPTFSICFAATVYCATALQQARLDDLFEARLNNFFGLIALLFLLTKLMEMSNLSSNYPRFKEFAELGIDLTGIVFFFTYGNEEVLCVFWLYLGVTLYINYALDLMARLEAGKPIYVYFALKTAIGLVILALYFGANLYIKVDQRVGGGKPLAVKLTVDEKVIKHMNLPDGQKTEALIGKLIYKTDKYLFIDSSDRMLRIRDEDVHLLNIEKR